MEPISTPTKQLPTFIGTGSITVWTRKGTIIPEQLLAALVYSDLEKPWWANGSATRLFPKRPSVSSSYDDIVVYQLEITNGTSLATNHLQPYTKYVAMLSETIAKHLPEGSVTRIQCCVNFSGHAEPVVISTSDN